VNRNIVTWLTEFGYTRAETLLKFYLTRAVLLSCKGRKNRKTTSFVTTIGDSKGGPGWAMATQIFA